MFKKIVVGLVVVGLMVGGISLTKHKGTQDSGQTAPFRLGLATWVGYAPFWLAQDKGFFAQEGIQVDITSLEDTAQRRIAMVQGSIDGLPDTVDSIVLGRSQNVPVVAVMQLDLSNGADAILAQQDIKTVKDLAGKKIAVQKNFVSEAFLNYVLQQNGMSPQDVKIVDTEAGAAGAAFVAGNVDVAVTFQPWISKTKERKDGHILVSSKDIPGVIVDVLNVREDYVKTHGEEVKKVLRAWFDAIEYIKAHPQESYELMAKHYNMTGKEFGEIVADGVVWSSYNENVAYFKKEEKINIYPVVNTFIEVFKKTGQITTAPDLSTAINSTMLTTLYEKK